jgi:hypothetical protein
MRWLILLILVIVAGLYVELVRGQIATAYQGIVIEFAGVRIGDIGDGAKPSGATFPVLITPQNMPKGWTGVFLGSQFDVRPANDDWKEASIVGTLEVPYFVDYRGRETSTPYSTRSWRWEVPEGNMKYVYVMEEWHQRVKINIAVSQVSPPWQGSTWRIYYSPVIWIKVIPSTPTYFIGNPENVYFCLADVEVYDIKRIEPEDKEAISEAGYPLFSIGTDIYMFGSISAGDYNQGLVTGGGWNPEYQPLAQLDVNGDGQPDNVKLDPRVWKPYWYLPLGFNKLVTHSWSYGVGTLSKWGKWRESYQITLDLWIFTIGEWKVQKTANVELQPYEKKEFYYSILEEIGKFFKSPLGILLLLFAFLLLLLILIILVPPLGMCLGAVAGRTAGGKKAARILEDLRLWRDSIKDKHMGILFIKLYYNLISPIGCLVMRVCKTSSIIFWKFVEVFYNRVIRPG